MVYAKLQSSHVRHQYGIFGGKSQSSFSQNATQAGSEEDGCFRRLQIMFKDKFPSIILRQMQAIVFIILQSFVILQSRGYFQILAWEYIWLIIIAVIIHY